MADTHYKRRRSAKFLMPTFGIAFLLVANKSSAVTEYLADIPNGAVSSCIACHVNAFPVAECAGNPPRRLADFRAPRQGLSQFTFIGHRRLSVSGGEKIHGTEPGGFRELE